MVSKFPERVGGALVLDFVNTRDAWLNEARKVEYITDYGDLVAWAVEAGALAAPAAVRATSSDPAATPAPAGGAPSEPAAAAAVHARALALRDALFELFAAVAHDVPAPPGPVAAVNAEWARLETRPQLDPRSLRVVWTAALDAPLGPVLASAARLLRDGPLDRLRMCPGPDGWCGALFLDRTRNRSRRWCSMAVCGNPAKMRARAARGRAGR
jgi:predicted RNA-binding Zn ribbon-like protein